MAKTPDQIAEELSTAINNLDATLDTVQGPIPDLMIRPQAGVLSEASVDAENLRQLFTLQFGNVATEEEIRQALANYGSTPGGGSKSQVIQYFMRTTRPTVDVTIPAGSLVSNSDGSLVYSVVTGGTIYASSASTFQNPTRGTYEIGLLVQAVGAGSEYSLAPYRIQTLITPIPGIDSTENRTTSSVGQAAEAVASQETRLKTSLLGINLGSAGGISSKILNALPDQVSDVSVIEPFAQEFTRVVSTPALDIYVIGTLLEATSETIIATGGQTLIPLSNVPAASLTSVTVNGSSISGATLIPDTSPETGKSVRALDQVELSVPLISGEVVVLNYTYNKVPQNVQTQVFSSGEGFLFNTDILVRYPDEIGISVIGEIRVLPSFDVIEVQNNVTSYFETLFTFTSFTEVIYPETTRQEVLSTIAGIQSFKLTEFKRYLGSLSNIEPLFFNKNEIAKFDATLLNIRFVK